MTETTGSHAELMDQVYRRQRYVYDFTRKYYLLGRDRLIREMALPEGASVVEVGCGTARNLIEIAAQYPSAKLFGLDASAEMLQTAAASLVRANLAEKVTLRHGYAEALDPGLFEQAEPFDAIVFSYSLSMIPDWKQSLKAAAQALKRTGEVHIVDFGDLGGSGVFRTVLQRWLALFHVEPREELLRTLEANVGGGQVRLRTLSGRYAFLFSSNKEGLSNFS